MKPIICLKNVIQVPAGQIFNFCTVFYKIAVLGTLVVIMLLIIVIYKAAKFSQIDPIWTRKAG